MSNGPQRATNFGGGDDTLRGQRCVAGHICRNTRSDTSPKSRLNPPLRGAAPMAIMIGPPDSIRSYDPLATSGHERGLVEEKGEGGSPLQTGSMVIAHSEPHSALGLVTINVVHKACITCPDDP